MFLIKYGTDAANTVFTTLKLAPQPTEVDYPERRNVNVKSSKDGSAILQRPLRDSRPRKWVWVGYNPLIATYENQWTTFQTLDAKARAEAGLNPVIYIWENDSVEGGFDRLSSGTDPDPTYSNVIWTAVKFVQVTRKSRKGGGLTKYDESIIEFVIEDGAYTRF